MAGCQCRSDFSKVSYLVTVHGKLNSELTFEKLVCWCSNDPIQGVVLEKWKFSKVSSTVTLYSKKTCRLTFEKFICWYSDNGNQGVLLEEARTRKCHEQERLSTNLFVQRKSTRILQGVQRKSTRIFRKAPQKRAKCQEHERSFMILKDHSWFFFLFLEVKQKKNDCFLHERDHHHK